MTQQFKAQSSSTMDSLPPSSSIADGGIVVGSGGDGDGETITTLHPDIIRTHILTRLDGQNLSSTACVSSHLRSLSTEQSLWSNICCSTWPSVDQPRVKQVISSFPSGYRSFFSDSFPFPNPQPLKLNANSLALATELISAVDIYHEGNPIWSKVQEMETSSSWFLASPFRVDIVFDPKDSIPPSSPIKCGSWNNDTWLKNLDEKLSLSWILIDPTRRKAVNISSKRAVLVQRHWMTGNVQVRFGLVMEGNEQWGSFRELVECGVVITCGGKAGGEMRVRDVRMMMEDMEGKGLNGKESLVILQRVMENGRRKERNGKEGKEKYVEFEERKKERKVRNERKDRVLDSIISVVTIVVVVHIFLSIILSIL